MISGPCTELVVQPSELASHAFSSPGFSCQKKEVVVETSKQLYISILGASDWTARGAIVIARTTWDKLPSPSMVDATDRYPALPKV